MTTCDRIITWNYYKTAFKNNNHLIYWDDDAIHIALEYAAKNNWENQILSLNLVAGYMLEDEELFHEIVTKGQTNICFIKKTANAE